jgi:hypothetical protein
VVTYLTVRDSAVGHIKTAFAGDPRLYVEAHPGTFDEEEIRRLVTRTPAILTSLARIRDQDIRDESRGDFVSWVLYRATNRDRRYDGALKIVSALIPAIRSLSAGWAYGGGDRIEAECLYSGSMDKINVTLWAVKWSWLLRAAALDGEEGGILLPDDLEYFAGYDADHLVGTQTAGDSVNLEAFPCDPDNQGGR